MIYILLAIVVIIAVPIIIISQPVLFVSKETTNVQVDTNKIKEHIHKLISTDNPRNYRNIKSLNQAADYISNEFKKLNLTVEEQKYEVEGNEYKNLICSFGPKEGERIIVGAHYDVCGEQAGADDNASGVVGLIEVARLLTQLKPVLKYRIDLVAYTLEEPPFFRTEFMGSYIHAKSLKDNAVKVKAMICLEMIGYFSDKKKSQEYPVGLLKLFYPDKGNFIAVVSKMGQGGITRTFKKNMRKGSDIDVRSINAPAFVQGIDFSDHLNYWNFGYNALMINNTAFYRNKNYHESSDVPESLDYKRMAEVIKGAYWALVHIE
ncbi:MAG: M28 family peptidase [Bacteroidia bacterium]